MTNMQLEKSTAFQLLFESNIQFFFKILLCVDFRENSESCSLQFSSLRFNCVIE